MRGAIFDVDGTLLDSMNVWWKVLVDFFAENNAVLSDEEAMKYYDMTLDDSIPLMKKRLNLSVSVEEIEKEIKRRAAYAYAKEVPLKQGAGEYLKKLHSEGVKTAIATSGYEELCKTAFERLGVWKYIDACAFSSEVGVDKANPDVYLLAAERIGAEPCECIVYEDILKGIGGAAKGGFKTCAVYDDTNASETEALKQLADHYITGWTDLL